MLLPHSSGVRGSILSSGYCLCGASHVSPLLQFPFTFQKHAARWNVDSKSPHYVCVCVCVCVITHKGLLPHPGCIPSLSFPRIAFGSTATLTRRQLLLKKSEWLVESTDDIKNKLKKYHQFGWSRPLFISCADKLRVIYTRHQNAARPTVCSGERPSE